MNFQLIHEKIILILCIKFLKATLTIVFLEQEPMKEVQSNPTTTEIVHEEDEREAPAIVIYLVDPFSMGSDQPELQRLACLALLRCFQSVITALPENLRSNISTQVSRKVYE